MNKKYELSKEIAELKAKLRETNDQAIMFAVGEITAEEYAETKAKRKAWREEINAKEAEIKAIV
jgi:hypothetical protein